MNNCRLVLTFSQLLDAHLAKGYLQSERIPVLLNDEYRTQMLSFYAFAGGGVRLFVKEMDYERSLLLLEKGGFIISKKDRSKDLITPIKVNPKFNQHSCPFCHSDNFMKTKEPSEAMMVNLFVLLFASVIPLIIPLYKNHYLCFDCGKKWKWS